MSSNSRTAGASMSFENKPAVWAWASSTIAPSNVTALVPFVCAASLLAPRPSPLAIRRAQRGPLDYTHAVPASASN
ncbi:hypothetical protein [Streptomyces sp. NPDC127119]|uniref:hypothetical protein n=1 Tax=Streptomyces sp. NPDC127119 TaxID=3345370 RepID=UPI0036372993